MTWSKLIIGSLTCVAGVRLTQRTQISLTPLRFIKISDSLTRPLIIESEHEDSWVTKIDQSWVTFYSYKAILRWNSNNASFRLILRLLELRTQTGWLSVLCCDVLFTSGLTFSLQVLVRRGHCKVCEGESLECILVVQLVGLFLFTKWWC